MHFVGICCILLTLNYVNNYELEIINIGGMFDGNEEHKKAFLYAIDRSNKVFAENKIILTPFVEDKIENEQNPYKAMNLVCELLNYNIVTLFGPRIPANIDIVQSICDEKEIPHILTRWNYRPLRTGTILNFYPHPTILCKAIIDIILTLEWKTFTLLYEDTESLMKLVDVIKDAVEKDITVTVKQLDPYNTGNYRDTLKEAKLSQQKFFIIDCSINNLKEVLLQVQQVGLMNEQYNYVITNLDTHTEDLLPFQYSGANITGIRLVNPENQYVQEISSELFADEANALFGGAALAWKLRVETALLIDAVNMLSNSLQEMAITQPTINLQCNSTDSWAYGYSLINLLKTSSYRGLTGLINFNHEGFRTDLELDVFEVKEGGLANFAKWNSTNGINITRSYSNVEVKSEGSLRNKTFIIIAALTDPYQMLKETHEVLVGNDRFEGFGIDLFHELSLMEGFNYTFIMREDKSNGAKNLETGKWTGMIGDVMDHRADLAITDLTITSERAEAVDFTTPFMNLGITILFRKPGEAPPSFFSFADPFAIETWVALALAYFIVSIFTYIMGRMSQDEWTNPYPCIEEPEYLVNQFSLQNAFWFATGSLMQQGTEIAPIAISTRMTAGVWWFFVLIMVSSYTANLAAFLATENSITLFTDVYSLVENSKKHNIRYGAKAGGATYNFFRDSTVPVYQQIYDHMKHHPEDMPKENDEGVALAEKETYAFFMESTTISYVTQRHCDLQMYGKLLDEKGYGIAMRKNSFYRQPLSTAILKLQSSGVVENLRRKWWEERRGGGQCGAEAESQDAAELKLPNVSGVFYVTIFGIICSMLLVFIEYLIYILKVSRRAKISFKEAFTMEFKNYINFNSNVKPAVQKRSASKSLSKSKSLSSKKDESVRINGENKSLPYGFLIPPLQDDSPKEHDEELSVYSASPKIPSLSQS